MTHKLYDGISINYGAVSPLATSLGASLQPHCCCMQHLCLPTSNHGGVIPLSTAARRYRYFNSETAAPAPEGGASPGESGEDAPPQPQPKKRGRKKRHKPWEHRKDVHQLLLNSQNENKGVFCRALTLAYSRLRDQGYIVELRLFVLSAMVASSCASAGLNFIASNEVDSKTMSFSISNHFESSTHTETIRRAVVNLANAFIHHCTIAITPAPDPD